MQTEIPVAPPLQADAAFKVERWPTELPLKGLLMLAAAGVWLLLIVSVFGIIYAVLIGLFALISHLLFIAYVRGNGVRLGPDQFPELYSAVVTLSAKIGLPEPPEAYLMQAGGALNALATKFLRSKMIILYSDLIEACGDNAAARDMIIAHELAHLKCGHLNWIWFLLPGFLIPFLGPAYSRACEYTSDRYGAALAGDREAALKGLGILAAGGKHGVRVNFQAMVRQKAGLNTGLMTLGKWLMGHPPLCDRIAALDASLLSPGLSYRRGVTRALAILGLVVLLPTVGVSIASIKYIPKIKEFFEKAAAEQASRAADPGLTQQQISQMMDTAEQDAEALAAVVRQFRVGKGRLPKDVVELYQAWKQYRPEQDEPLDPFDHGQYGYGFSEQGFYIWSSGPDGKPETRDDLVYSYADQE